MKIHPSVFRYGKEAQGVLLRRLYRSYQYEETPDRDRRLLDRLMD